MTTVLPRKIDIEPENARLTQEIPFGNHHSHFISLEKSLPVMPRLSTHANEAWDLGSPTCLEQFSWLPWNERPRNPREAYHGRLIYPTFQRWEYEPLQYTYTYHLSQGQRLKNINKNCEKHPKSTSIPKNLSEYTLSKLHLYKMWPSVAKFWYGCARWNRPEALMNQKDESQLGILSFPWM